MRYDKIDSMRNAINCRLHYVNKQNFSRSANVIAINNHNLLWFKYAIVNVSYVQNRKNGTIENVEINIYFYNTRVGVNFITQKWLLPHSTAKRYSIEK